MKILESLNVNSVIESLKNYSTTLLLAIITLVVGWWLVNLLKRLIKRSIAKLHLDANLGPYVIGLTNISLKAVLLISVAGILGVETTSFVTILGAAGLAIGLALKENLSNFAAGIFLLIFKPFKVGDYIQTAAGEGTVEQILIFQTFLVTPDQKVVIVPNSTLVNNTLTNFNSKPNRRLDLSFGIAYQDDIDLAKNVLLQLATDFDYVLGNPAPQIFVSGLLDSCVELNLRVWMKTEDYWPVRYYLIEEGKKTLDKNKISIPFPQRDVHLYNHNQQ